jgi:hypothetical protein
LPEILARPKVFCKPVDALPAGAPGEGLGVELVIPFDGAAISDFLVLKGWNGGKTLRLPKDGKRCPIL